MPLPLPAHFPSSNTGIYLPAKTVSFCLFCIVLFKQTKPELGCGEQGPHEHVSLGTSFVVRLEFVNQMDGFLKLAGMIEKGQGPRISSLQKGRLGLDVENVAQSGDEKPKESCEGGSSFILLRVEPASGSSKDIKLSSFI